MDSIDIQNILIVDDEKSNIDILLGLFEKINKNDQFNVIAALSGEKALKVVEKRKIDLILLDIMMPDMDGYEVCKILKLKESTKNIPILFITANTDDESIIKAYNIGAADYVTKPFRPVELLARVKVNLKLQQTINKLEYFAYYDVMTNIYNRRKFFDLSSTRFEGSKDNLYAVMLDIDKFKSINDTYGHSTGDVVIKAVAKTMKENLDDGMILGRLGGEEFAIVCDGNSNDEVLEKIEDIRKKIQALELKADNGTNIKCTISDGIAKYNDDMPSIDHLLQKADEALYEAKETGRNKSIFRI
jgi:diguanylate cyclase (GGDEF)-like protein